MFLKQIKKYWKLYKASLLGTKSDYWIGIDYAKDEPAPIMTPNQRIKMLKDYKFKDLSNSTEARLI
ncbi:MAG: hypothetical protein ACFFG0_02780 [Candidatus Thorarchaeota archaeon]